MKVVQFTIDQNNRWNLGFGDWKKGEIDDTVVTNNYDVAKVMRTITMIIYQFFEKNPERIVYIEPVDEKRKRLYNLIFQRHILEIIHNFEIIGLIGEDPEIYSSKQSYDAFEIKLKINNERLLDF